MKISQIDILQADTLITRQSVRLVRDLDGKYPTHGILGFSKIGIPPPMSLCRYLRFTYLYRYIVSECNASDFPNEGA